MSVNNGPQIISSNLIYLMDFDNYGCYNGIGNTPTDLVGQRGLTILSSASIVSNLLLLNNPDNIAGPNYATELTHNFNLDFGLSPFSISFWVNIVSWNDGHSRGIIDMKTNDTTNGWTFYNDGGRPTKINARIGGGGNFPTNNNVTTNIWENWVFVRDVNNVFYWYLNGNLDTSMTESSVSLSDPTAVLKFGFSSTWQGYYNGQIGPVYIYNAALNLSQVSQNFNAIRSRFGV